MIWQQQNNSDALKQYYKNERSVLEVQIYDSLRVTPGHDQPRVWMWVTASEKKKIHLNEKIKEIREEDVNLLIQGICATSNEGRTYGRKRSKHKSTNNMDYNCSPGSTVTTWK